jgi:uroporphyrinogen-III decarboxylase
MKDIAAHLTDLWLAMLEVVVAHIDLDMVTFFEDMAFKTGPMISPHMFDEFCASCYRRITGFLRAHGVETIFVDTDGNCWKLIPRFMECGVNGLWPMEAQAGMNVAEVRRQYPNLLMIGGLNKMEIAKGKAAIDAELEAKLPAVLSTGGYIPTVDHLVHPDISWADFSYYRARVREYVFKYQRSG